MNILSGELIGNEKMKERFEMMIESPTEDMNVRKTIVMLLGIWSTKFKGEHGMQVLYRLHERGRALIQGQSSQVNQMQNVKIKPKLTH